MAKSSWIEKTKKHSNNCIGGHGACERRSVRSSQVPQDEAQKAATEIESLVKRLSTAVTLAPQEDSIMRADV